PAPPHTTLFRSALEADLTGSDLADDPWFSHVLAEYFPTPVRERFAEALEAHPLRENLIVNEVANSMINRGGMTVPCRAMDETGADGPAIARAYTASREIFRITEYTSAVGAADNHVPVHVQSELYMLFRRALDRAVRHFLIYRPGFDLTETINELTPLLTRLLGELPDLLVGAEAEQYETAKNTYLEAGVDADLAAWGAGLLPLVRMLDVIRVANAHDSDPRE